MLQSSFVYQTIAGNGFGPVQEGMFVYDPAESIDGVTIMFDAFTVWYVHIDFVLFGMDGHGDISSKIDDEYLFIHLSVDDKAASLRIPVADVKTFDKMCANYIESHDIVIQHEREMQVDRLLVDFLMSY